VDADRGRAVGRLSVPRILGHAQHELVCALSQLKFLRDEVPQLDPEIGPQVERATFRGEWNEVIATGAIMTAMVPWRNQAVRSCRRQAGRSRHRGQHDRRWRMPD
jgi:hypothetical protein